MVLSTCEFGRHVTTPRATASKGSAVAAAGKLCIFHVAVVVWDRTL